MQTQTPIFDIWTDGSFYATGQSGAGIVFTDRTHEVTYASLSLPTTHMPIENSIHSEIVAATQALQMAQQFASVTGMKVNSFHADNDAVLRLLAEDHEPADARSQPLLKHLCDNLRTAFHAAGGNSIKVEYASDKKHEPMKLAHKLASEASRVWLQDYCCVATATFDAMPETSAHSTAGTHDYPVPPDAQPTLNV